MRRVISRRDWIAGAIGSASLLEAARPKGIVIESHVHLFADDQKRFPYHRNAVYRPAAEPLEKYVKFAREAGIDHAVIVHPEPYQDDHSYLEYCFEHEPSKGFFKGTCLFDAVDPATPARIEALVKKHPGRIVALRIHEMQGLGKPPSTSGAIRDRDMQAPEMLVTWRKVHALGLAIQMHSVPYYAPQIRALASKLPDLPVILDHLGRFAQGTPAEYEEVLRLADLPRVYIKYSSVSTAASKQPYPYADAKPLVRRIYKAFGPDRIIWGVLGMDMAEFERQAALLDLMFDFAPEAERAKIRGLNAMRFYGFKT